MAKKEIRTYPIPKKTGLSKDSLRNLLKDLPNEKITKIPQGKSGKNKRIKTKEEN